MNQIKNIQIVSGCLFYILGFFAFSLIFLIHNQSFANMPLIILKSIDLPFALVGLLYGLSSLRLSLGKEKKSEIMDASLLFIGVFLFMILVYFNFGFLDYI